MAGVMDEVGSHYLAGGLFCGLPHPIVMAGNPGFPAICSLTFGGVWSTKRLSVDMDVDGIVKRTVLQGGSNSAY
jgi:hypothetical protein